ncbi:hypothetical protein KIPB_002935 [Kipferlia bialata]|uniref:Protein kinase domain-containing protein n=1 Tax=Kipferlia bialata TaxID=797122 RepID=A0A391NUP1_9EUKA|nr:hypothetical protein KIPB_002935 [Kipferlia bialata]|eukprot:g2935.t1
MLDKPAAKVIGPREFQDVLSEYPQGFYDYEQLRLTYSDQEIYYIYRKIGRGKYSDVFEGYNAYTDSMVVIKVGIECVC